MPSIAPRFRRRPYARSLEALERRIAPATVNLPAGAGPYTLEVDPATSHLHIKNGAGMDLFDQGAATGDDLTVTGGGAGDVFNIENSAAGSVSFTGTLQVNFAGDVLVHGPISAGTVSLQAGGEIDALAGIATSVGGATFSANTAIFLDGGVNSAARIDVTVGVGGGSGMFANGGHLISNTGVTIVAGDVDLTNVVNGGSGSVQLLPANHQAIDLGTDTFNKFGLTQAELGFITASILTIGDTQSGAINVSADVSFNSSTVQLVTGAALSGTNSLTLPAADALLIRVGADSNFAGLISAPGAIGFDAGSHDFTATNAGNSFGNVVVVSGHAVSLRDDSGFNVADANFSSSLSLDTAGIITQSGLFVGGGDLIKAGFGTLVLSLANSHANTLVKNGAIYLSNAGGLGSGVVTLGDASSGSNDVDLFVISSLAVPIPNDIVVPNVGGTSPAQIGSQAFPADGEVDFTGTLTLDRPTILYSGQHATTFFDGTISGNVSQLTVAGGGEVDLQGTNTFVGNLEVSNAGTVLEIGSGADVIPNATNVMLDSGTTLSLAKTGGQSESINCLIGVGVVTSSANVGPTSPQTLIIGAAGGTFQFDGNIFENSAKFSLTKAGSGSGELTGTLDYSGATVISGGVLALNSANFDNPIPNSSSINIQAGAKLDVTGLTAASAPQTLVLNSGQVLFGSGEIEGSLGGSGRVDPGGLTSTGVLAINGSFRPTGLLEFNLNGPYNTAGTDYDQIVVSGAVDLSGATFSFFGGTAIPAVGKMVTLISRTAVDPTIAGTNPAEGSHISVGNAAFTITYNVGDGNDVVLTAASGGSSGNSLAPTLSGGRLTVTDTKSVDNHLRLAISGDDLVITDDNEFFANSPNGTSVINNGHSLAIPLAHITNGISISGGGGNDTLEVDLSGGPLPDGGLTFNGGTQTATGGDALQISDGDEGVVTYNFINAHDGSIDMSSLGKISYTGLEPIANFGAASEVIFNLPAGTNSVILGNNAQLNDGISRLSGPTFEQTDFLSSSGKLTIHRGSANDALFLSDLGDFNMDLALGDAAHPFQQVVVSDTLSLDSPDSSINIAATQFSLDSLQVLNAAKGTLTLGGGVVDGQIKGGLALTKVGPADLFLNGANTYTGQTLVGGPVTLGDAAAAEFSTVFIASDSALHFASGISTFVLGGLAGPGDLTLANGSTNFVLQVGSNDANTTYSGTLLGAGTLDKLGSGTLTLTGANAHSHTVLESGVLQVASDHALGFPGNPIVFRGGTLHATNSFTTSRDLSLESGSTTFEASNGKVLTLAGDISGAGDLAIGSVGQVVISGHNNTNTGSIELPGSSTLMVNKVSVTAPGATGDIIITPGSTPGVIDTIDFTKADKAGISLVVKAPANGTALVGKIVSNDTTPIKAVTLGLGVTLGNGMDDMVPDLVINGKLGKLQLDGVSDNTIIDLGKGLAYLATYANHPNVKFTKDLGANVTLDVAGVGNTPGGMGGGGLGKVVAAAWSKPSTIMTSQSIKSITVKTGNFGGNVLVDPNHLGMNTVGNVGKIAIPNGQWVGTGMQVEGIVASFLTAGVSEGTKISAGAFGPVAVKGNYAGKLVATSDPSVKNAAGKRIATGGIGSVAITGDFTGLINGDGAVGNVTLSGSGRFMGTLRGGSIGDITASSFSGAPAAGPNHTITAIGSIGNIVATSINSGIEDYIIAAGTDLGSDAIFGGVADRFASMAGTAAVKIGNVTVKAGVSGTTIAAGVNPGADGIYGTDDDTIAAPAPTTAKTRIGVIKFGSLTLSFVTDKPTNVGNAIEAQAMTSVQLGKAKAVTAFTAPQYVESRDSSIVFRTLPGVG